MIVFIDTSSLVKRYILENGSDKVDQLLLLADKVIIASITRIELLSALSRRLFEKTIEKKFYDRAWKEFETEVPYFEIIPFGEKIEKDAMKVIQNFSMKSLDAIQLSSALNSDAVNFITSDTRLYNISQKVISWECTYISN